MALQSIKATFSCDGCGRQFLVGMDSASEMTPGWTLFELAEDFCRGGGSFLSYIGEPRSGKNTHCSLSSVQGKKHLCPECTEVVDEKTEKDNPTEQEVEEALKSIKG